MDEGGFQRWPADAMPDFPLFLIRSQRMREQPSHFLGVGRETVFCLPWPPTIFFSSLLTAFLYLIFYTSSPASESFWSSLLGVRMRAGSAPTWGGGGVLLVVDSDVVWVFPLAAVCALRAHYIQMCGLREKCGSGERNEAA